MKTRFTSGPRPEDAPKPAHRRMPSPETVSRLPKPEDVELSTFGMTTFDKTMFFLRETVFVAIAFGCWLAFAWYLH